MTTQIHTNVRAKLKAPPIWEVVEVVDGIFEVRISIDNGDEIIDVTLMRIHLAEMQATLDEAMAP